MARRLVMMFKPQIIRSDKDIKTLFTKTGARMIDTKSSGSGCHCSKKKKKQEKDFHKQKQNWKFKIDEGE